MRKWMLALAVMLMLPSAITADEAPLTNADVVRMTAAGLSADTIIAKIRVSRTDFRTDTDSLLALAAQHVEDPVIREMIDHSAAPAPGAPARENSDVETRTTVAPYSSAPVPPKRGKRFDEISITSKSGGRCDHAEMELNTNGIKTTECHESNIDIAWNDVESVCYLFGFRGTMVLRTAGGEERRLSTTTPAEMKSIRDAVRSRSPKTREITGCK